MSDEPMIPSTKGEPQPDPAPTQREGARVSRRSKVWIVAALLVVIAAATGLMLWNDHTRSPQYSFAQMTQAARSGDWDGVERYMATGEVVSNLVDVGLTEYVRQDPGLAESLSQDTGNLGDPRAALVASMKPTLAGQMERDLRNAVEVQRSPGGDGISGFLFADNVKKATLLSKTMAIVRVSLRTQNGSTRDVRLHMKWQDDHWRIIFVEDPGSVPSLARRWQIALSASGL